MTRATSRLASALVLVVSFATFFVLDHYPRWLQGDSLAYLSTGLSGWIPPDRSWAYGFLSRWIVVGSGHVSALLACQLAAVMVAIWVFRGEFLGLVPAAALLFVVLASLDPALQIYSRFWLSDAFALLFFVLFLATLHRMLRAPRRQAPAWLALLLACSFLTVLTRIAYAPIELLTVCFCIAWPRPAAFRGTRGRLAATGVLVVLSVVGMAFANGAVSMERFGHHPFINKMGALYQIGVFAPALRLSDFAEAGVPITQAQFDGMRLSHYALREDQVWSMDGTHLLGVLLAATHSHDAYDAPFQAACARVVREGVLHHPWTFVITYLDTVGIYFWPPDYTAERFRSEMGMDRDLPAWTVAAIRWWTGHAMRVDAPQQATPEWEIFRAVFGAYAFVLMAGVAGGLVLLLRRAPVRRADQMVVAALLAVLASTPLYSHRMKPRYMMAGIFLSYAAVALAVTRRGPAADPRTAPPAI